MREFYINKSKDKKSRVVEKLLGRHPRFFLEEILNNNFPVKAPFSFIQIGANDGVSFDSLYDMVLQRKSKGVVVEPLSDYFQKLTENYSYNKEIIPVNAAIHPTNKEVIIYRIDPQHAGNLPDWVNGIGSLDPLHYAKSSTSSEFIISENVKAINFDELIKSYYKCDTVDFIQIDAEGFDYEILKQINLKKFRPKIIKYEYINLSIKKFRKSIKYLRENGFFYFVEKGDIIGLKLNEMNI